MKLYLRDDPTYFTLVEDSKKDVESVKSELDDLEYDVLKLVDVFLSNNPSLSIRLDVTHNEGVKDYSIERINCESIVETRASRQLIHDKSERVVDMRSFIHGSKADPTH